jgi:hypothetical protein
MYSSILGVINVVLVMVMFTILDRGKIISPAYGRLEQRHLAQLRRVATRTRLPSDATSAVTEGAG